MGGTLEHLEKEYFRLHKEIVEERLHILAGRGDPDHLNRLIESVNNIKTQIETQKLFILDSENLISKFKQTIPEEVINQIIDNGKTTGFEEYISELPPFSEVNGIIKKLQTRNNSLYSKEKKYFDRLEALYSLIESEQKPQPSSTATGDRTMDLGGGRRKVSSRRKTKKYRKSNKKSKKKKKKSKRKKKTKKSRN
jgi:hypothetical protein